MRKTVAVFAAGIRMTVVLIVGAYSGPRENTGQRESEVDHDSAPEAHRLREYLARKRRLPLEEALSIAKGVGEALAFAHRKGIVITDLSSIRALRVISRTSAMRFKGSDEDVRTIARELDVSHVLEGNVRRAGQSLRVTAQLIDAQADSHLWSEKYSGDVADVFAIQEEISRKIAKALEVRLSDTESRAIAERPIDNPAGYDLYIRARHEVTNSRRKG